MSPAVQFKNRTIAIRIKAAVKNRPKASLRPMDIAGPSDLPPLVFSERIKPDDRSDLVEILGDPIIVRALFFEQPVAPNCVVHLLLLEDRLE